MNKKRLICAFLAAVLSVSLASCGPNTAPNGDTPDGTVTPDSEKPDTVEENYEEIFVRDDGFEFSSEKGITEYAPTAEYQAPEVPVEYVSDEYLASIDEKADAMRESILNTKDGALRPDDGCYGFYVSESGDDSNTGLTPSSAWKTLKNVNNSPLLKPGTVVYFERGGVWRGQLVAKDGVTYTAYGEGKKPCLYGSPENGADASKWVLDYEDKVTGKKIWKYSNKMMDSGTLVFDDGDEGCAYKEVPNYIDGKFMLRRNISVEFDYKKELDNDLEMFQAADSFLGSDGKPQVGNDTNVGYIYLRCDRGNPGEVFKSIEFLPRKNGFQIGGAKGVTIDNFTVKYVGSHGVGAGTCADLTVQNCEFGWIGGGIQTYNFRGDTTGRVTRYGNAIEIYGGCDGFNVDNNYIYQIYDAGITHQVGVDNSDRVYMMNDVYYTNNLVEYCTYNIEYFLSGVPEGNPSMMTNINMTDNLLRFAGNGWGEQRPDTGSAAHIKSWSSSNPSTDFVISDNIFDRGYHRLLHIAAAKEEHLPKMDGNIYIQYYSAKLGMFGPGNPAEVVFDENVEASIREGYIKDENAEIYYAKPVEGGAVIAPLLGYDDYLDSLPSYSYVSEDGTLIPFRVVYPSGYKKEDKLPMVVVLHSEYQNGNDNREQARLNADIVYAAYSLWSQGSSKCIFLFPQCRDGYKWVNTKLAPSYSMDEVGESRHLRAVAELIPIVAERFGADSENVSAVGVSEGATAVWDITMRHPNLFKRAAVVCGGLDSTHAEAVKPLDVIYAYHGTNDVKVRIGAVEEEIAVLQEAGVNVVFTPLEEQMHDCWKYVLNGDLLKSLIQ